MFEPQNISATGSTGSELGALTGVKPRETTPEVEEPTSFRGDDEYGDGAQDQAKRRPEAPVQKLPRARLSYSLTEKDAFVEILNPRTGDVIKRFPPEQAEDELRAFVEGDAGLFLDRVA